jgi:prefoldin alpha subunit
MASTTPSQPQQINVADLDLQQLSDVRRQLEEVP